jgi:lysophospholipase L1-like esterase
VTVFPTWFGYASLDAYPFADLHAQVAAEVRRHGLEALDLLPAFRASGLSVAELKADDEHPNAAGHAVAARAIAARIEELGWLSLGR